MSISSSSATSTILPTNSILLSYFSVTPDSSAQNLASEITSCKCYLTATVALQSADNGTLYFDYYTDTSTLLFTETIVITTAPIVTSYIRNIESRLFRVRLSLDNTPTGTLGLFVTLRKKYA